MFSAVFDLNKLDGANGFAVPGIGAVGGLGSSVSTAGDINGDGIDDIVLGASSVNSNEGASYIIFGQRQGFPASFDLNMLNGTNGFTVPGISLDDRLGYSVSRAGDINGDRIDDVVLGAPANSQRGASYIIFGGKNGFPASFDLNKLNGVNGFNVVPGISDGGELGFSVSTAGDINGDGIDDIVLGTPDGQRGRASYIIFGKKSGFSRSFNLTTLDGSNGFAVPGLIYAVSTAGDMNGDGIDDIVLGALVNLRAGQSYIIFGQNSSFPASFNLTSLNGNNGFIVPGTGPSVSRAGDINGDGLDDIVLGDRDANSEYGASYIIFGKKNGFPASFDLNKLNGVNGFRVPGTGFSVSTAGDINSDGIDDIVLGAPYVNQQAGESYIIFGRNSSFPASFNLTTLNGKNGFIVSGISKGGSLGSSVSTAGDINGDGIDDIMLGASSIKNSKGVSYVIFGQSIFSPTLWANNLLALQGKSVVLTTSNLNATDAPNSELTFLAYNVTHGQFEYANQPQVQISQFSQHNISSSIVQFRTDNSSIVPFYDISVMNNRGFTIGPYPVNITFHDTPILVNNRLLVSDGKSVILSSTDLSATEKYTPAQDLIFIVKSVTHGQFQWVSVSDRHALLKSNITQFWQQNVSDSMVQFTHDCSNKAPFYKVSVSDGVLSSPFVSADITFHDAPVLGQNQLIVTQGQPVFLTPGYLSASENYTIDSDLIFNISDVQHGCFCNLAISPGAPSCRSCIVTQFAQRDISDSIIQFIPDGSANAPSYSVSVNDGLLSSGAPIPANITFTKSNSGSNTNLIDKMGGWGGIAGIIIGGILLICTMSILSGIGVWRYFKSRKPRMINITKFPDSNRNDATEISSVLNGTEKQPFLQAYEQNNLDPIEALSVGDALSQVLNNSAASDFQYPASLHQKTRQGYSSLSENSPKLGRFHGAMFNQKPASTQSILEEEPQQQEKKVTGDKTINL